MKSLVPVLLATCFSLAGSATLRALPGLTVSSPIEITATPVVAFPNSAEVVVDPATGNITVIYLVTPSNPQNREIRMRRFDNQGTPFGPEITLLTQQSSLTRLQAVLDPKGNLLMAWRQGAVGVRAACFDLAGQTLGGPWLIQSPDGFPGDFKSDAGGSYFGWSDFPPSQVKIQRIDCDGGPQGTATVMPTSGGAIKMQIFLGANGRQVVGYLHSVDLQRGIKELVYFEVYTRSTATSPFTFSGSMLANGGMGTVFAEYGMVPDPSGNLLGRLFIDDEGGTHRLSRRDMSLQGVLAAEVPLPVANWGGCDSLKFETLPTGNEVAIVNSCDSDFVEARILSKHGAPYSPIVPVGDLATDTDASSAVLPNGDLVIARPQTPGGGFGSLYLQFVRREPGLLFYDGFESGSLAAWLP